MTNSYSFLFQSASGRLEICLCLYVFMRWSFLFIICGNMILWILRTYRRTGLHPIISGPLTFAWLKPRYCEWMENISELTCSHMPHLLARHQLSGMQLANCESVYKCLCVCVCVSKYERPCMWLSHDYTGGTAQRYMCSIDISGMRKCLHCLSVKCWLQSHVPAHINHLSFLACLT